MKAFWWGCALVAAFAAAVWYCCDSFKSAWEQYPPEQIYVQSASPDGSRLALFSVRHQGIVSWIPNDVEPYCYVTLVNAETGRMIQRETLFAPTLKEKFLKLAEKHAPWAVEKIQAKSWG